MKPYESLGAFYLGRRVDPETGERTAEPLLYDAKDLTTHAVCVGMTGSGKTGLGIAILEEAAIDGIPAIAIDPKGDLGNLLLAFPKLAPADFRPWIDESRAARAGRTPDEEARATADLWRSGLAEWDQGPERVRRYAGAVEHAIYTPGSLSGRPLSVLRTLTAPDPALLEDADALRDRVLGTVSGLMGLLGIDADPVRSREHILLSTLIGRAWRERRDLDLPTLIHQIQKPPVERLGVLDIESFFPAPDRTQLAFALNGVVASPGFAAWAEGEPLDVGRLLYTESGKPRHAILSIAHLSDRERMFVVTTVLSEVLAWMRAQPGTGTLRAILYMDEVFGYLPPTANPPSKLPLLTLLKQARAYGLGLVLSTQNPVDLDYKALSNAGTWLLGRLQTERDKARVLDGLETASAATSWDRETLERTLSRLESRRFVLNNVHEDEPVLMETRWVLSYLAGPMTRTQIQRLLPGAQAKQRAASKPRAAAPPRAKSAPGPAAAVREAEPAAAPAARPVVPAEVEEGFLAVTRPPAASERLVYRPSLLGVGTLHYANARAQVDAWESAANLAPPPERATASPWPEARHLGAAAPDLDAEPEPEAGFAALPRACERAKSYPRWQKMLATHLYREHPLILHRCRSVKLVSRVGETEGAFRGRVREARRERRDLAVEKLRKRYAPKLARLQDQIRRAEARVDREEAQYKERKTQTAISIGATVLGALFGRKLSSVGKATTAVRGASRAAREKGDIARAEARVEELAERLQALEATFEDDLAAVRDGAGDEPEVEELRVPARKSDLDVAPLRLVWAPYRVRADGIAEPAFE